MEWAWGAGSSGKLSLESDWDQILDAVMVVGRLVSLLAHLRRRATGRCFSRPTGAAHDREPGRGCV